MPKPDISLRVANTLTSASTATTASGSAAVHPQGRHARVLRRAGMGRRYHHRHPRVPGQPERPDQDHARPCRRPGDRLSVHPQRELRCQLGVTFWSQDWMAEGADEDEEELCSMRKTANRMMKTLGVVMGEDIPKKRLRICIC